MKVVTSGRKEKNQPKKNTREILDRFQTEAPRSLPLLKRYIWSKAYIYNIERERESEKKGKQEKERESREFPPADGKREFS